MEKLSAQADVAALRDCSGRVPFYGRPRCKTQAGLGDHPVEMNSTSQPSIPTSPLPVCKVTSRLRLSRMTTLAMPLVKRHEVLQRVISGQD